MKVSPLKWRKGKLIGWGLRKGEPSDKFESWDKFYHLGTIRFFFYKLTHKSTCCTCAKDKRLIFFHSFALIGDGMYEGMICNKCEEEGLGFEDEGDDYPEPTITDAYVDLVGSPGNKTIPRVCKLLSKSGLCELNFDPKGFGYEACTQCIYPPEKRITCVNFVPEAKVIYHHQTFDPSRNLADFLFLGVRTYMNLPSYPYEVKIENVFANNVQKFDFLGNTTQDGKNDKIKDDKVKSLNNSNSKGD